MMTDAEWALALERERRNRERDIAYRRALGLPEVGPLPKTLGTTYGRGKGVHRKRGTPAVRLKGRSAVA